MENWYYMLKYDAGKQKFYILLENQKEQAVTQMA